MPRGPIGPLPRRVGRSWIALGLVVIGTVSCGRADPVAEGADLDRPPVPSMADVRLADVAADVGLDSRHSAFRWGPGPDPVAMMGGGLCWIDYDGDGWLDLYQVDTWSSGEWGRWRSEGSIPRSRLFRNDTGRFVDVTEETGAGVENRGMGCVAADLDDDGWTDLYVTTERENVLLWNDGGRGFTADDDLPAPSGAGVYGWHAGASAGDVDGDGRIDLFVAGYTDLNHPNPSTTRPGFPNPFVGERDVLLLNDGPVGGARARFRDVATEAGIEPDGPDYGLGAELTDLDLDGDLDLHVANDTTPNQLYENRGPDPQGIPRFVEIGGPAGVADEGAGMGVASSDLDGDGRPELTVTNQLDELHVLARNTSSDAAVSFTDLREEAGVPRLGVGRTGWGASWADLDLDGDLDLALAHGAIPVGDLEADREPLMVLEDTSGPGAGPALRDVSATIGLEHVGPVLGRGLAAADYDNDGDVDLAVGTIGSPMVLLRNTGAGGNWLVVALPTPEPGAVVTIRLADGTTQRRELVAGSSYLSSEDPRALFGLGAVERVDEVLVELPDGRTLARTDVAAGQVLELDPAEAS